MLVRTITIITGSRKGVLCCGGGVARNLLEREGEVLVGSLGEVVVDGGEVGDLWVGGNGISDLRAEWEVVYDLAIIICKMELLVRLERTGIGEEGLKHTRFGGEV